MEVLNLNQGVQDSYLTGNPEISFFKVVYRKHTNFAIKNYEVVPSQSTVNINNDSTLLFPLPKSGGGDLFYKMYVDVEFDVNIAEKSGLTYVNWTNNTGHAFIKKASINIGSSEIDSYTSEFADIYNELTDHDEKEFMLINKHKAKASYLKNESEYLPDLQMMIPLKFWFNRNIGLSLPICAMEYNQNINVKLNLRNPQTLINHSGNTAAPTFDASNFTAKVKLYSTGIYLSEEERRRFKCTKHVYLIEQFHQEQEALLSTNVTWKGLNNPVKEIFFVVRTPNRYQEQKTYNGDTTTNVNAFKNVSVASGSTDIVDTSGEHANDYFEYDFGGTTEGSVTAISSGACIYGLGASADADHFDTLTIKIGSGVGNITENLKAVYYRTVQPLFSGHRMPEKRIYCYSFATDPEKHQPTGTINFSTGTNQMDFAFNKINTAGTTSRRIFLYAINYNIFVVDASCNHVGLKFTN